MAEAPNPKDLPANIQKVSLKHDGPAPKKGKADRPEIKKIIDGEAKVKKPSITKRFKDNLKGDDAQTVGEYILMDVIIPATKRVIVDSVSQGIERMLYGTSSPRPVQRINGGYSPYSSYGRSTTVRSAPTRRENPRASASFDFNDIVVPDLYSAEQVISSLGDLIDTYEVATVADFYSMVGVSGNGYTDRAWGWTDIRGSRAVPTRDGFMLILPKPIPLPA